MKPFECEKCGECFAKVTNCYLIFIKSTAKRLQTTAVFFYCFEAHYIDCKLHYIDCSNRKVMQSVAVKLIALYRLIMAFNFLELFWWNEAHSNENLFTDEVHYIDCLTTAIDCNRLQTTSKRLQSTVTGFKRLQLTASDCKRLKSDCIWLQIFNIYDLSNMRNHSNAKNVINLSWESIKLKLLKQN